VDRREEARAAAVSEERLPRVAHAGPAGDGDLRAAGGEARPDAIALAQLVTLRIGPTHLGRVRRRAAMIAAAISPN
jgi:hypothetical protein